MSPLTPRPISNNSLDKFKSRRDFWINCLDGDDRNAIVHQISRMVWNAAAFRVINEARNFAPSAKEGGVQLNGLMHRLIDSNFFDAQLLAIRRLTDRLPITGHRRKHNVASLTSLLDDMGNHANLMTRENIFKAEGLEYDIECIQQKRNEYALQKNREGQQAYFVPPELNLFRVKKRHEQIDLFARVCAEKRSPDDAIRIQVMKNLKDRVNATCEQLRTYIDNFLAHAANPESRQDVEADKVKITLNHLYKAHEIISKVANFVSIYLLGGAHHNFLAIPQYDQFVYMDKPLVSKDDIPALRKIWKEYEDEMRGWANWGIDGFQAGGLDEVDE